MKKKTDVCPVCLEKKSEPMTKDHIVPKVLMRGLQLCMGISHFSNYREKNVRKICVECNNKKGHGLDWSHPATIAVMKKVLTQIKSKLK